MSQDYFRKTLDQLTQLNEGCWSLPDTPEKVKGLAKLLSQPLHADAATHALYDYIGDDELFDRIGNEAEWMDAEGVQDRDIRDLVIGWMQRNVNRYENSGIDQVLELLGEPLNELSQKTLKSYRSGAERKLSDISNRSYRGEPIDIRDKMSTARGLDRVARKIQEEPAPLDQEVVEPSVDQGDAAPQAAPAQAAAPKPILTPQQQQQAAAAEPNPAKAAPMGNQIANTNKQTTAAANSATQQANAATANLQAAGQKIDQAQQQKAPAKAAAPMANNKPTDGQYVIKKGDTLSAIAKANGTTVQAIMKANPQIKDANRIAAGAGLNLPQKAAQPAQQPNGQQGDDDAGIAQMSQQQYERWAKGNPQEAAQFVSKLTSDPNLLKAASPFFQQQVAAMTPQQKQQVAQIAKGTPAPAANAKTTTPNTTTSGGAPAVAESIKLGDVVRFQTATNMLTKARVVAINEGQLTVQTRWGTDYLITEADLVGLGEKKGRRLKGPVVEGDKPDFIDADKDGDKKEPMKKALKSKEKSKECAINEKAVSKKQQKFMGMVHAAQKGEKPASKEVAKVAKTMKKSDAKDFAKTKHKGLPNKKKATESTTSGGVAVAPSPFKYQNEATMKPVKMDKDGVYESQNRKLERMIRESMNVSVSMNKDGSGGPSKTLNINATDEDAEQLARLLNLAGLGNLLGGDGGAPEGCDMAPAQMQMSQQPQGMVVAMGPPEEGEEEIEALEENMPDWPTNPETSNDPFQYSGGLNRPKSTGQTTVPVTPVAQMNHRGGMFEDVELERSLFKLYQNYKND